jgi:transcriptional regulator with XRE-family HTH domain
MSDDNKDFDEVMGLLRSVPGVTEHLESIQVKLGKEILKRRLALGWTQAMLVEKCNELGMQLNQPMLSRMESGMRNIEGNTYQKVFDILGGILDLRIEFGPVPEELEKKHKIESEESSSFR